MQITPAQWWGQKLYIDLLLESKRSAFVAQLILQYFSMEQITPGDPHRHLICGFYNQTKVTTQNGTSTGSAVFAELKNVKTDRHTDWQTDRPTMLLCV